MSIDHAVDLGQRLEAELGRTIVGQRHVIRDIRIAFLAGGHCLLRGLPALAKTLIIKTLAPDSLVVVRAVPTRGHAPSDTPDVEVAWHSRGLHGVARITPDASAVIGLRPGCR